MQKLHLEIRKGARFFKLFRMKSRKTRAYKVLGGYVANLKVYEGLNATGDLLADFSANVTILAGTAGGRIDIPQATVDAITWRSGHFRLTLTKTDSAVFIISGPVTVR